MCENDIVQKWYMYMYMYFCYLNGELKRQTVSQLQSRSVIQYNNITKSKLAYLFYAATYPK